MLLLILNSMHSTATDRQWARLHSKTPPAKKTELIMTTLSSSSRCESAADSTTLLSNTQRPAGQSSKKITEGVTDHEILARAFS